MTMMMIVILVRYNNSLSHSDSRLLVKNLRDRVWSTKKYLNPPHLRSGGDFSAGFISTLFNIFRPLASALGTGGFHFYRL